MPSPTFDDPGVRGAMKKFLDAVTALERAIDLKDVVDRSDAKTLAGLTLRKRLVELGWTAPSPQRTSR